MSRAWKLLARDCAEGLRSPSSRRGARVFCYHGLVERITDPLLERNFDLLADFRAQLDFLRRFRVVGPAELAAELRAPRPARVPSGRAPARPAAVITFDDGYANNTLAAELLAQRRMPGCIFVTTGAVGGGGAIWTVELSLLLLHGEAAHLEALERRWPLATRPAREAAFAAVRGRLKRLPAPERRAAMDAIRGQFPVGETARLLDRFPSLRMLPWEEIGALAGAGIEIGSHGVEHELHHAAQPAEVCRRELRDSRAELERRLQRPCVSFAFPNGDFNPSSSGELEAAGYQAGFTTLEGTVEPGCDPFLIPRLAPVSPLRRFLPGRF